MKGKENKPIFFKQKEDFYNYLKSNKDLQELWVGFYKKNSKKNSISWSDSVDIALCFGWIDGVRKSIDSDAYKIRFTPRKENSQWSAVNVKKVKQLIKEGKISKIGLELFKKRKNKKGYSSQDRNVPLNKDYEKEIKKNIKAWKFFNNLAPSYKRDSIWWIMSAKKEETRLKRLKILIDSSSKEIKIPSLRKRKQ